MIVTLSIVDGKSLFAKRIIKRKIAWLPKKATKSKSISDAELKRLRGVIGGDAFDELGPEKKPVAAAPYSTISVICGDLDTVSDFKARVAAETGIPVFRQHIWSTRPLGYSLNYIGSPEDVNIERIKTLDLLDDLPIDMELFHRRDDIEIATHEWCEPMASGDYYMVDLSDFIGKNVAKAITDTGNLQVIYSSFILPYWPQLSISAFVEYVSGSISRKFPKLLDTPVREPVESTSYDIKESIKGFNVAVKMPYAMVVNMRNLFDDIVTFEEMPLVLATLRRDANKIRLLKKNILVRTDLLLKIAVPEMPPDVCTVYSTHEFGNITYTITDTEYIVSVLNKINVIGDLKSMLASLAKPVNSFLTVANSYGRNVFSTIIPDFDWQGAINVSNIEKSLFIGRALSSFEFDEFIKALYAYGECSERSIRQQYISLTWRRGMLDYDFDQYVGNSYNMYEYLYDDAPLRQIYDQKKIEVSRKMLGIELHTYGMTERELDIFRILLNGFMNSFKFPKVEKAVTQVKNKSKMLLQFDPELYDLKKRHGMATGYTTKCQHTKQPIVVNTKTAKSVKYWNFTNNSDAYYECPSKLFPHFGFLNTKIHKKGYCLPCCYSKEPTTPNKLKIHSRCITDHSVKSDALVDGNVTKSRHIISYIKILEIGRISRLPEHTLEPLLYNISSNNSFDEECVNNNQYFIFGVLQHLQNVSYVGALFAIASALKKSYLSFLRDTIEKIKVAPELRTDISNEKIAELITSIFTSGAPPEVTVEYINGLFIEISQRLWEISIVKFRGTIGNRYYIDIPPNILEESEYIVHDNVMLLLEDQIVDEHSDEAKYVYYPIYQIVSLDFFKKKKIEKTIFAKGDKVISYVRAAVAHNLEKTKDVLTIHKLQKSHTIREYFINENGVCYALLLGDKPLYFPIVEHHGSNKVWGGKERHTAPTAADLGSFEDVIKMLKEYNVKLDSWMNLASNVVGVRSSTLEYLFVGVPPAALPPDAHTLTTYSILYHPFELMTIQQSPEGDFRSANLTRCLYNHHIYDMFLFHISSHLLTFRDKKKREMIMEAIDASRLPEHDFKSDTERIHAILKSKRMNKAQKKQYVASAVFSFDNPLIVYAEKKPSLKDLVAKIKHIADGVFVDKEPDFSQPIANTFATCEESSAAFPCHNGKMMIRRKKLDDLVSILASEISRLGAYEVLAGRIIKNYINQFHFTHRKNEVIHISL